MTRIIRRKGIETAIEPVERLDDPCPARSSATWSQLDSAAPSGERDQSPLPPCAFVLSVDEA